MLSAIFQYIFLSSWGYLCPGQSPLSHQVTPSLNLGLVKIVVVIIVSAAQRTKHKITSETRLLYPTIIFRQKALTRDKEIVVYGSKNVLYLVFTFSVFTKY